MQLLLTMTYFTLETLLELVLTKSANYVLLQISKQEWFSSWLASDQQLHFVLQSLNYSSLYDFTRGQFSLGGMDFW